MGVATSMPWKNSFLASNLNTEGHLVMKICVVRFDLCSIPVLLQIVKGALMMLLQYCQRFRTTNLYQLAGYLPNLLEDVQTGRTPSSEHNVKGIIIGEALNDISFVHQFLSVISNGYRKGETSQDV